MDLTIQSDQTLINNLPTVSKPRIKIPFVIFIFLIAILIILIIVLMFYLLKTNKPLGPTINLPPLVNNLPVSPSSLSPTSAPTNTLPTLASLSANIKNSRIFIQRNDGVYLTANLSQPPTLLIKGDNPDLLNSEEKIVYSISKESESVSDMWDQISDIIIYDIRTGKSDTFTSVKGPLRGLSWSPDGQYVEANFGTGAAGSSEIYLRSTKTKIASFPLSGSRFYLKNNQEIVFDKFQPTNTMRPWESGDGTGVYKLSLLNNTISDVLPPTDLANYGVIGVENNLLQIRVRFVDNKDEWQNYDKVKTTFWQVNPNGGDRKEIQEPLSNNQKLIAQIRQNVFSDQKKYSLYEVKTLLRLKIGLFLKFITKILEDQFII